MNFGENYFSVVSVYPATDGNYDWWGASKSFMDMIGYERWINLRTNKFLFESKEVYVRTDISKDDLTVVRRELNDDMIAYYQQLVTEAHDKFELTFKSLTDAHQLNLDLIEAKVLVNKKFTEYLNANYKLVEF